MSERGKVDAVPEGLWQKCPRCAVLLYQRDLERDLKVCRRCGHHLHPMAGTAFDRSRVPLQSWFYAIYLTAHWRRRVPARTLARALGVSYPTALRVARTIGERMNAGGDVAQAAPPPP